MSTDGVQHRPKSPGSLAGLHPGRVPDGLLQTVQGMLAGWRACDGVVALNFSELPQRQVLRENTTYRSPQPHPRLELVRPARDSGQGGTAVGVMLLNSDAN